MPTIKLTDKVIKSIDALGGERTEDQKAAELSSMLRRELATVDCEIAEGTRSIVIRSRAILDRRRVVVCCNLRGGAFYALPALWIRRHACIADASG